MSEFWLSIFRKEVEAKGAKQVSRELNISASTISLVLSGKYPASTDRIEERVMAIYGNDGKVDCPVMGKISPGLCVSAWEKAKKIGVRCGNPATIVLHKACLKCDLRQ